MDSTKSGEENFKEFISLIDENNTDWRTAKDANIIFNEQDLINLYRKHSKMKDHNKDKDLKEYQLDALLMEFDLFTESKPLELKTVRKLIKCLTDKRVSKQYERDANNEIQHFCPTRELFIWAILTKSDPYLHRTLWENMKEDPIVSALVASIMMKSMGEILSRRYQRKAELAKSVPDSRKTFNKGIKSKCKVGSSVVIEVKAVANNESKTSATLHNVATAYAEEAKEYEKIVKELLKIGLARNAYHLSNLLIRELPQWSDRSLFWLKYHDNNLIMTEDDHELLKIVQQRLNEAWGKHIAVRNSNLLIPLCILFPFPHSLFPSF